MEHISKYLANFPTETSTMSAEVLEPELTKEQRFMTGAGLSTLDHTFNSFKHVEGTEKAYRAARNLGNGHTDKPFLLLYGGVGNGKTHLVEAIIIELGRRGIWARYWTAAAMFDFLKAGIQVEHGHPDVADRIEQLCRAQVLVLDDLGVEKDTDWQWSNLERIVDYRYRFRSITIVATNMDIDDLEKKSERIVSRFSDKDVAQLVLNKGNDYRQRRIT